MSDGEVKEAAGYWWTEAAPEKKVAGVLSLADEGRYRLKTIGALGSHDDDTDSFPQDVVLFGKCQGDLYTLLGAGMWTRHVSSGDNFSFAADTVETWTSLRMVHGGHIGPGTRFKSATLGFSGLPSLWGWQTRPTATDDDGMLEHGAEIALGDGCRLQIYRTRMRSISVDRDSYEDRVRIDIESDEGLTLDEFEERFVYPLNQLVSIVTGHPAEPTMQTLSERVISSNEVSDRFEKFEIGKWTAAPDTRWSDHQPILKESDHFFPSLVAHWLSLAGKLITPMVLAAPRRRKGFLESETFAVIAGAEKLQRELTVGVETPFADSVRAKLYEHREVMGLNSADRRRIFQVLKQAEIPLQQRLEALVSEPEGKFFQWFLKGHVREWAEMTARTRNELGHGLPQAEGHETNYESLIEVEATTRDAVMLRLLIECGYPVDTLADRLEGNNDWRWRLNKAAQWSTGH